MIKSFKIRLYPTKEQEQIMWKHVGACRYIWNYMLDLQIQRYSSDESYLSSYDMMKMITSLKRDGCHDWLHDISSATLYKTCKDLDNSYKRFFKKIGNFPKHKSRKKSVASFGIKGERCYLEKGVATIPKVGKVRYKSDIEISIERTLRLLNVHAKNICGKWILVFSVECENQTRNLSELPLGIDLGVKDLAVIAYGNRKFVFSNINKSKKIRGLEQRMKYLQKDISRKYKFSKKNYGEFKKTSNIIKEEQKLRKIYAKISNIRHDYIHQTTHRIISFLPYRVVMEDLNIVGMMKNRHLSKAIGEQLFSEFIRQMKYKCEWNGIEFIQANRFYPSSKTCSHCGLIKKDLKLSERTFRCECGFEIDRDYNAAINLSRYVA